MTNEIKAQVRRLHESLERIDVWIGEGDYPAVRGELVFLQQVAEALHDTLEANR